MGNKFSNKTQVNLRPKVCKSPPPEPREKDPCLPVQTSCCEHEIPGCLNVEYRIDFAMESFIYNAIATYSENDGWWVTDSPPGPLGQPWDAYLRCHTNGGGTNWQVRVQDDCGLDTGFVGPTLIVVCNPFSTGINVFGDIGCNPRPGQDPWFTRVFTWSVP